jgi:phospholipid-transporting ATPase
VNAAKHFGFAFTGRDEDNNIIIKEGKQQLKYNLLNVIEFTSARKRMTCVVKTPDGAIKVYIKGADSHIIPLLKKNERH